MTLPELISGYLEQSKIMQLATVNNGKPWICTVHYVQDRELNLYWLSLPNRRHSEELGQNSSVAVAVVARSPNNPLVGIQAEGIAQQVANKAEIDKILTLYLDKFVLKDDFRDDFMNRKDGHVLYKFTPSVYYLFDEKHYIDGQRHAWTPNLQKS